jgi:hypothetical protein
MTRPCADEIDGVSLSQFEVDLIYDVSASLGSYLIATGCAQAVLEDEVKEVDEEKHQFRVNVRRWREVAADISHRRSRRESS